MAFWYFKGTLIGAFIFCLVGPSHPLLGDDGYKIVRENKYQVPDKIEMRDYIDVILDTDKGGDALFTISLPQKIPQGGLPTILIVGGLKTGRESLQFVPEHGEYALVAYEYPEKLKALHTLNVLSHLYSVRKATLEVAPELIAVIKYLKSQPWMNHEATSVMGYSFGATFIPVTYVKAQEEGIDLGPGVMAYGGAGVYCLFKANLSLPDFLKGPVATMAAALFKPIDPILYAPHMKGDFLLINGLFDSQIPMDCAERLQNLVPEPKTIMNLETEHMSPKNPDLNLRLINISLQWLDEKRMRR